MHACPKLPFSAPVKIGEGEPPAQHMWPPCLFIFLARICRFWLYFWCESIFVTYWFFTPVFFRCTRWIWHNVHTHTHTQPFWSGATWVSWYQKKHSPTHTYGGHHSSPICFFHLVRSMAPSLFNPRAWQSFPQSLSKFSLVYLLAWHPPLHTPYRVSRKTAPHARWLPASQNTALHAPREPKHRTAPRTPRAPTHHTTPRSGSWHTVSHYQYRGVCGELLCTGGG